MWEKQVFAILLGPEVPHDIFKCDIYNCVMVCMWVGKECPNERQNERRIEFIRVRDAVRTVDPLKEELTLNRGP